MNIYSSYLAMGLAVLIGGVAMADDHDEHEEQITLLPEREIVEFLNTHELGHMVVELKELRSEEPEEYAEMLEDVSAHIQEYRELKEEAPELAEAMLKAEQLEHTSWVIAERIGESDSKDEQAKLKKELHAVLSQLFDYRLVEGNYELRELEEEIQGIRATLERRKSNREKIIAHRMEMMLSEMDDDLRW